MINNPMSQMADAQKLTITQLQQALRNGTIDPQVGQIVLASKIKQAKDAKAAMAAQMPKQPPVAQQNMAYGQGVDALPTNLPVQGMAQGGIISFAGNTDGSYVNPDFSAPGLSQADVDYANAMHDTFLYDPTFQQTAGTILSPGVSSFNYLADKIGGTAWVRDPKTGKLVRKSDLPKPTAADKQAARLKEQQAGLAQREAYNKKQQEARILANPAQLNGPYALDMNPEALAAKQAQLLQNRTADEEKPADAKPVPSLADFFGGNQSASASLRTTGAGGAGNQGIGGYKITPYDDKELQTMLESEYNPATKKPWTYEEKAAENRKQGEAAGIDYDVYKSQREELNKLKEKSAKRSKLDEAMPWFAASEAFARQPKAGEAPQSAIGAITGALGAYGKSATELDEKEEVRKDKIRSEGNALALAQNAFNQAQFSGNKADIKEAQSAVRAIRTNLANLGVESTKAQNEVAKTVYETQAKERMNSDQIAATMYSADRLQNNILNIARAYQADNPGTSNSEAIKQAYEISNPGFAAINQRDAASQRDAIKAQIVKIEGVAAYSTADKAAKDRKLAILNQQLKAINAGAGTVDIAGAGATNAVDFSNLPK
jgi:hypothetical protein